VSDKPQNSGCLAEKTTSYSIQFPTYVINEQTSKRLHSKLSEECCFACSSVWVWNLVSDIREEHRLKVLENRVLGTIFGPKGDKIIRGCRILHNEELYKLYSSPSIIRMMRSRRVRFAGYVAHIGRIGMHIGF
jgi:hypothetical protein